MAVYTKSELQMWQVPTSFYISIIYSIYICSDIYKRTCVAGADPSLVESPTEPKWSLKGKVATWQVMLLDCFTYSLFTLCYLFVIQLSLLIGTRSRIKCKLHIYVLLFIICKLLNREILLYEKFLTSVPRTLLY